MAASLPWPGPDRSFTGYDIARSAVKRIRRPLTSPPAMGSVGDAYDNALCESFFATLECELLDRERFRTPGEARRAVFDYIERMVQPAAAPLGARVRVAPAL